MYVQYIMCTEEKILCDKEKNYMYALQERTKNDSVQNWFVYFCDISLFLIKLKLVRIEDSVCIFLYKSPEEKNCSKNDLINVSCSWTQGFALNLVNFMIIMFSWFAIIYPYINYNFFLSSMLEQNVNTRMYNDFHLLLLW